MTKRFSDLNAADRALLLEAAMLVVCVRVGLRVMTFPALRARLDAGPPDGAGPVVPVARIVWATAAVMRRLRGTTCLVEALTVHTMLRRHGHDPALKLGVREAAPPERAIAAHAWVECDGVIVTGTVETLADYAVLS